MTMQVGFSFIAGLLTTLSPCVLPILPFLLGTALRKNRNSPLYLVLGLCISFIIVGFTISRFGSLLGLSADQLRYVSATLLITVSAFLLSTRVSSFFSEKLTGFSNIGLVKAREWKLDETSGWDSLILGGLLGIIWSPCAGPTLGIAVSFASQEGSAFQALKILAVYALGAAVPMLCLSYGFNSLFEEKKKKILRASEKSRVFFGIILLFTGVFILLGLDKVAESMLLGYLPESWIDLITSF